jgi:hypothetical protein
VNLDACVIASGAPFSRRMCRATVGLGELNSNMLCFVETKKELFSGRKLFVFKTTCRILAERARAPGICSFTYMFLYDCSQRFIFTALLLAQKNAHDGAPSKE